MVVRGSGGGERTPLGKSGERTPLCRKRQSFQQGAGCEEKVGQPTAAASQEKDEAFSGEGVLVAVRRQPTATSL